MKKESSEQQQRVLRKLVRSYKPSLPAMSIPGIRKLTPVGRRNTRSEATKNRTEKVSPTIKLDSKQSEDSSESTDSQSEPHKQNNVPATKTNGNQSEINSPQEAVEEKGLKKPRKKRVSRALFRHDTIDYIKPKKQELLQKTFSLGFKKLVNKSKEIYSRNDDQSHEEDWEISDKETKTNDGRDAQKTIQVECPMKSPENSSTSIKEKQSNPIIQKSIQHLILDMPSLDSPNSQSDICTVNKMSSDENETKKKEKQKPIEENAQPKKTNSNDKLSTTTVPRNIGHIENNSSQKLQYPFYGLIPNKQNTVAPNERLNNEPTIEDQIPTYKITIVNGPDKNNPPQYILPPQASNNGPQFKIPPPLSSKHPETQNQIKYPQMHSISQMPYPYFHPNYGHTYHYFPYMYPQNYMQQEWNQLSSTNEAYRQRNTLFRQQKNAKLNQDKLPNLPTENQRERNINLSPHSDQLTRFPSEETIVHQQRNTKTNQEKQPENITHINLLSKDSLLNQQVLLNQENLKRFLPVPQDNFSHEKPLQNISKHQEYLRQLNTNLTPKKPPEKIQTNPVTPKTILVKEASMKQNKKYILEETHLHRKSDQENSLNHKVPVIHQQNCTIVHEQSYPNCESRIKPQNVHKNLISQIPVVQNIAHRYRVSNPVNDSQEKINNKLQSSENTLQGQKRCGSPIINKTNHKRVRFESNLADKNNLLYPINNSKPDSDKPITNVNKMPNVVTITQIEKPTPEIKESVIVSPNNQRSIPETSEQRVIIQTNENLHNNLHNQNTNNILVAQNHTPAENNNKIMQSCSVIKKVCTESKNQHTIEHILSDKCSAQNKTNPEVNNNRNDIIHDLNSKSRTVITNLQTVLKYPVPKIKSLEYESFTNNSTPARITTRRKTLQHIDLTQDTDHENNTNALILEQQTDSISKNDTRSLVVSSNRLPNTHSEKNTVSTPEKPGRAMPKLIKIPDEYLNKIASQTSDNRNNNYASKTIVPFLKPAHSNTANKTIEPTSVLPLNLSLKKDAQTKESDQNKRQSIIVNNSSSHEPVDLTNLSFVKSEEEYKGYLKLLKDKNATGPYLFYKFVTMIRKRNNQPIFDLITFFSLLKQGKLVEYKNMYNHCNNN